MRLKIEPIERNLVIALFDIEEKSVEFEIDELVKINS